MNEILGPVEGCTRCWCGAKYWDVDARERRFTCVSCGETFRPRDFIRDEWGTPQPTLDGVSVVW